MDIKTKRVLSFVVLINIFFNILWPFYSDELYYWVWSKRLQLSYFDHPPMVAYFIKIFTIFSDNKFFIRLPALFSISLSAYIVYQLAKKAFDKKVAKYSIYIFLSTIIVQGGFMLITPDSPLILFWTLSLYFAYEYIFEDKRRGIYLASIFMGCAFLSKYTAILIAIVMIIFLLSDKEYRKVFFKKDFYLAVILGIIVSFPVLYWNYQNDFISFGFQFNHGVAIKKIIRFDKFLEFIGGQILIFHPVYFVTIFYFIIKYFKYIWQNKKLRYFFINFIFVFIFFAYNALYKKSEPNWTAPAYISGAIFLAYFYVKNNMKKTLKGAIIFTVIVVGLVKTPEFIPILPKPIKILQYRLKGFDTVYKGLDKKINLKNYEYLLIDSYHGSEIAYYLNMPKKTYILDSTRFSQYDLWKKDLKHPIKRAIYIGKINFKEKLEKRFSKVNLLQKLNYRNDLIKKEYFVYECIDEKEESFNERKNLFSRL
ncbi:dolichyl-phosphate-mannose-protein mannosyltransferase [Hypnocyclicus thermotrophus]|uniref:Dolichyl-phosphate-mannose-protein mannosyltransferase n=1 Tax=Hypnocyclicus thermotrophus TaxID=1627895 RepID=A0AA46DXV2_9FUSO|nr:glycosyltransferase family 39 protein [Hypnocyclicus thermotrophus]TDT69111.1 dolichyl-phosphate-mannose-protein mannosyltransferase [Hypnocyclicus thermotrophus]